MPISLWDEQPIGCIALGILVFWCLYEIWRDQNKRDKKYPDIEKDMYDQEGSQMRVAVKQALPSAIMFLYDTILSNLQKYTYVFHDCLIVIYL